MSKDSTVGFLINIYDETILIGNIEYYHNKKIHNINVNNLFVYESYRGKGYGTFLMFLMFINIGFRVELNYNDIIRSITLNDSSDFNSKIETIYIKLGFKIEKNNHDTLSLIINKNDDIIQHIISNIFLQTKKDIINKYKNIIIKYELIINDEIIQQPVYNTQFKDIKNVLLSHTNISYNTRVSTTFLQNKANLVKYLHEFLPYQSNSGKTS